MQSTTPIDPRVLDAMLPFMTQQYGNPHSRTHQYGWESEKAVDAARVVGYLYGNYIVSLSNNNYYMNRK
jgi:selenocysteine lyase/cysteine desulfurase